MRRAGSGGGQANTSDRFAAASDASEATCKKPCRSRIWERGVYAGLTRSTPNSALDEFRPAAYLEEADQLCDRLAIIDNGKIVAEGTPEQLKAEMGHDVVSVSVESADVASTETALFGLPGLERVVAEPGGLALYVEDGAGSIAEIVRRLERDQIRTGAISVARPSLDDVFLKATGRRLEGQDPSTPSAEVTHD